MSIYSVSKWILVLSILITIASLILYFLSKKGISLRLLSISKKHNRKPSKFYVKKNDVIYNALLVYPQLEDFLYYEGAKSIKNPIVKTTFTKKTTFSSLARSLGKDEDEFIIKVNNFIEKILEED